MSRWILVASITIIKRLASTAQFIGHLANDAMPGANR